MKRYVLLAAAGALGTLCRYGLSGLAHRCFGASFPWGTFTVNITGCLVAGCLWAAFEERAPFSAETRIIVLVGFFGAFTTFSALMIETGALLRDAEWMRAMGNIAAQNVLGLAAVIVGAALGRLI